MKKASILSLSLLTVMAGAAVAPALGVIREYFTDAGPLMIQLIISIPAIFIFLTSFIFPELTKIFTIKKLVMLGLTFYLFGGCLAGVLDSIWPVLIFRALTGIGVGIIMPLSTGLLSYYYPPEELDGLMGLSSAMNQMGGVIATLLAGMLAQISWRASFLVYLLGLICFILCAFFLPNDMLTLKEEALPAESETAEIKKRHPFLRYRIYIFCMFFLMMIFFLYPANFAIETTKDGFLSQKYITVIMAFMDLIAFIGGLCFVHIKKILGTKTLIFSPLLFLAGYLILALGNGWAGPVFGSALIGFANGCGDPAIISEASGKAGKAAVSTVMPLLSAAIYLGQFIAPFAMSAISWLDIHHLPYWFAACLSVILIILTLLHIRKQSVGACSL